ncbi:asparagine synthase (glutamine-hydrolyzing) [Rummeliibacillus sp. G93]|uniref:asparagine synthase (glutamine-hydrolyzing) n=1 Tax=Rummeliibacillus stabekisii TaxID=241244 RepID=A0A143HDX2_9BACL|nr:MULTISPECIES: asparagine synthase (glutamine-hydrolyzing) [Rummeliibacillus]AMW99938.1 asparagine synthetase B [Rummeliibacillus stabekisii]MBB5170850.1 asparagine synthase (glutamine-hydrolyzing) [Rummeliibacillus stabekisii]MCM3317380.1 asparagine synthase (glutamine-hydrolyzing) [Rummeliibacillus stabekisii]UQW96852.1 asparagine synthase (glutamine-hydrolyzing) [Rummeliibacillus sp. G93]GEL05892.1 asparagine synthetase B [Rummeliibacillus stabekisii]
MCGFTGFIGEVSNPGLVLENMMNQIIHRGPDSAGDFTDGLAALGFRRLSIIDVEHGSQPLYNEDQSLVLIFNGEIYNFQEIREDLLACGHTFKTDTDSEVLIHGYEEYGPKLVQKLRGMFAFVIWDRNKKRLFAARDMFGIKPFYYAHMNGTLLFGSEIKSFLPHPHFEKTLNEKALKPYLTFQFPVLNETFFKGVFKLPAAHYLTFEDGKLEVTRYWEPKFHPEERPLDEIVDEIDDTVRDSIKAHEFSDPNVQVGSFLSSGVDSSYVASVLKPDKTFSVGFSAQNFSEIDNAKELSTELGIENINEVLDPEVCFNKLDEIQYMMDEPHSNPSIVPLYFLAELARKHVTVVLSGEGADELFGGYAEYDETPSMRKYKKIPQLIRRPIAEVAKVLPELRGKHFLMRGGLPVEQTFIGQAHIFEEKEATEILADRYNHAPTVEDLVMPVYKKAAGEDDLTKKQLLDLNLWLVDDILLKADKMSMAHSIELRVPFLDREVMKVASKVPSRYRVNEQDTKFAFRKASERALPSEWANRKKIGFPVPIRLWLQEDKYFNKIKEAFESPVAAQFFDQQAIVQLLTDHYEGKAKNQRKVWTIYMFLVWYNKYFG